MDWLLNWVDRFWPDWVVIVWAWFAMVLGAIFVLISVAETIGHYFYGRPMMNGKTDRAMTPAKTLTWLLTFGGAGAVFGVLGFLTYQWKSG